MSSLILTPQQALVADTTRVDGAVVFLRDGRELVGRSYGWAVLDPNNGLGPVPVSTLQAERILTSHLPRTAPAWTHGPASGLLSLNGAS